MNKNYETNAEFIQKMAEAKKLEKEAVMLLFPESVRGHLEVIENEIKEILKEYMIQTVFNGESSDKKESTSGKVKKVDIG